MDGVRLVRLGTSDDLYLQAEKLISEAFVADERRDEAEERSLTMNSCIFSMNAIMLGDEFVGVLAAWNFGSLTYIEHLAVVPQMRRKGLGRKALHEYLQQTCRPAVLEVEPRGAAEDAERRIAFYASVGFKEWGVPYVQPSYGKGRKSLPMTLMAYGLEEVEEVARLVIGLLRTNVYRVTPQ